MAPFCDVVYVISLGEIVDEVRPGEEQDVELPFKIPVRLEDEIALVNPVDILRAEVQRGRAPVVTASDRMPTQLTLTEFKERLSRSGFFRAHRGHFVDLQHVKEVIPFTHSSFSLRLDNTSKTEIPLR